MQPSAIYRRGIVLPLDPLAEKSLRAYDVCETTNVRLLRIPDDGMFENLWRIGLFEEINLRCNALLDEYEEEIVEASSAKDVLAAIESVAGEFAAQIPDVVRFLADLRNLVHDASRLSRPLLFVL